MPGVLISIEGLDGAGKSSLARELVDRIRRQGLPVQLLREPGGTRLSEKIRTLVLDPENSPVAAATEAFLYLAARAQLVATVIRPALERGEVIVCDRFIDSTLAYQGGGRGLDRPTLEQMNLLATGGLVPRITVLLDIEPELGRERRLAEERAQEDRLEAEDFDFYRRIRSVYLELAEQEPERIKLLSAILSPLELGVRAWEIIRPVLPGGDAGDALD